MTVNDEICLALTTLLESYMDTPIEKFPSSFNLDAFFSALPSSMKESAMNGPTHLKVLKAQAKLLRSHLATAHECEVSHAQALDLLARSYGFADFNHARAHLAAQQAPESSIFGEHPVTGAAIPDVVRSLLAYRWTDKLGTTARIAEGVPGRISRPSYYRIAEAQEDALLDSAGFSYVEAKALTTAGAFGEGAELRETSVCVNEHASHSLQEFLGEVTQAWARHQERLERFVRPVPNPASEPVSATSVAAV